MPPTADITTTPIEMAAQLGHVFYYVVLPILLLAGVGWLIQRRLGLDMPTLTRLNFYFVMPGMTYFALVTSHVTVAEVGAVVLFSLAMIVCLAGVALAAAWVRRVPREYRNTLLMTAMFYNSGNYGLPLQRLAFQARAEAAFSLQTFVVLTQNIVNFTVGVWLAATGRGNIRWRDGLAHVVKFPPIYSLAAGLLTIWARNLLGDRAPGVLDALAPFHESIRYVNDAFVAVALCTLGAQLATVRHDVADYPITVSVVIRLLLGPAIGLALIYAFGLSGFLAQLLLISTSAPTAINVMMLCLHFDNHPDYAARAVFYSTLLSPVTVTLVIFFSRGGFLERLQ